ADPVGDLVLRYARTHGPFTPAELAKRYALGIAVVASTLEKFVERGRLIEGEFRPGGTQREWCDNDVLRAIRRRSLAKLRQEIEPVEQPALARVIASWQGVTRRRRGLDGILETLESIQGYPLAASIFENEILTARIDDYKPSDLDTLSAAGEVVWVGVEPLGGRDGRVALYLTDHLHQLRPPVETEPDLDGRHADVVKYLRAHGASFFAAIHDGAGGGFPAETVDALWDLVWKGIVTNDTMQPLRAYARVEEARTQKRSRGVPFRSRRLVPPRAEGRWALVGHSAAQTRERERSAAKPRMTKWAAVISRQLLSRHGVVTRETVAAVA